MGKEVKNRVSLDASRFTRGTRQVKRNIKQLERGLTIDMKKAARIGSRGVLAVGAATAAAGAGMAIGIKNAIELGARLDHLSTQTGIAAGELRLLEQAFEDNGASASMVGKTVSRLQRRIVKAEQGSKSYADALGVLGLKTQDLINMTPDEQFKTVAAAISQVENQSRKAQAAMELFGNEGAKLMGVFESGAIDSAGASLGAQTEILNRRAADFEKASTLLDRSGNKLQGFFVGISDRVIDTIMPLLERMDAMDFAAMGQNFGDGLERGIRTVIGVFEDGTFGNIVSEALTIAGKNFINVIAHGWTGIFKGAIEAWKAGFLNTLNVFKDGIVKAGLGLKAVILTAISKAIEAIPGIEGSRLGDQALIARREARNFKGAGTLNPKEIARIIQEGFGKGMADMAEFDMFDTSQNKRTLDKLISDAFKAGAPEESFINPFTAPPINQGQGQGQGGTQPSAPSEQERARQVFAAASSLAQIGGGGGVGGVSATESLVDQSKQQTRIQKDTLGVMRELRDKFGQDPFSTMKPQFMRLA
jgi:hypothetical protein